MRIPKIYGKYTTGDKLSIIDIKLRDLIRQGTIPSCDKPIFNSEVNGMTSGRWCQEYWDMVVEHLLVDDIIFVLSHVQESNWNHCLYKACENKWSAICISIEKELLDAE